MKILGNRVLLSPLPKEEKEGFQTVEVQDSFVYKGRIEQFNSEIDPNFNTIGKIGDTVLFAKYSPDTHEFEHEGKKYKSVLVTDVLAVL